MEQKLINLVRQFMENGEILSVSPFGSGHINDTYKVAILGENGETNLYILQRLNTVVFPDPDTLTDNAVKITEYLRDVLRARGDDPERGTIRFYPAKNGKYYCIDVNGQYWRFETLIRNTMSHDLALSPEMFEATGNAFGSFMSDLAGFPADQLGEVIPNFHNTEKRFETFINEVRADRSGRGDTCREEIRFALDHEALAGSVVSKIRDGSLPLRVTHNDTKINNILMDVETGQPVCIVDLDTVMPGAACYDFGDSIRFGASSALEDEKDLQKVYMRMDLFSVYTRGFMKAMGKALSLEEARSLALGSLLMTYENGIRFLGDYLNGDVYFKIAYPEHNLIRARNQFKLVTDMESKLPEMYRTVEQYWNEYHN